MQQSVGFSGVKGQLAHVGHQLHVHVSRLRGAGIVVAVVFAVIVAAPEAARADTTIGFDDRSAGEALTDQYAGAGVTFAACADGGSSPNQIAANAAARSAPNVVAVSHCGAAMNPSRLTASFSSAQSRVSAWVRGSSLDHPEPVVMTGLDGGGGAVLTASAQPTNSAWTLLSISQPAGEAPRIASVRIERANFVELDIDDFGFGAEAQPPPPSGGAGGSASATTFPAYEPFTGLGHGPHFFRFPDIRARRFRHLPPAKLDKVYTEHLGFLFTAPGRGGVNDLGGGLGIRGTDLGSSFEVNGRLAFLFGDSWTVEGQGAWDSDSLAWTVARRVGRFNIPRLAFDRQPNGGQFNPQLAWCAISCRDLIGGRLPLGWQNDYPLPVAGDRGMEVPVEGLQVGGKVYIFLVNKFHSGAKCCEYYDYSVLAEAPANNVQASHLQVDHIWGSDRFLNISAVQYGGWIYLFGAGNPYRVSSVGLARVRPGDLPDRNSWTYYRGIRNGRPDFRPDERYAQYMVPDRCVGELSVRYHRPTGLFLMAYACGDIPGGPHTHERGYYLRFSRTPWGPWSQPEKIMDDARPEDGGYTVTMHRKPGRYHIPTDTWELPDDGLSEPDHLDGWNAWGGEYGPYLVPRWFRTIGPGIYQIVWVHSSWHPYKVHLMRTVLVEPGVHAPHPPVYGRNVPAPTIVNGDFRDGLRGWRFLPFEFNGRSPFHAVPAKGRTYATSFDHGGAGDAGRGMLYQDFTPNLRTCSLEFRVHGGHATRAGFQAGQVASVRLYHREEVVRETFGLDRNDRDVTAQWNLVEFRGEPLRLAIFDNTADPWGFISATAFRLVQPLGPIGRPARC